MVNALATPGRPISDIHHGEFFDALVLLHGGHPEQALTLLGYAAGKASGLGTTGCGGPGTRPCGPRRPCWPWRSAAAVRIGRARRCAAGNSIALAMVERSAALAAGDRGREPAAAADRLSATGCRISGRAPSSWPGGPERAHGEDELAAMGAIPMADPGALRPVPCHPDPLPATPRGRR